jgi:hypothetical protein
MQRAGGVDFMGRVRILDRSGYRRERCIVEDVADSVRGSAASVDGPQVTFNQFDVIQDVYKVFAVPSREIIKNPDAFFLCQQGADNMAADESGSASNQV